MQDQKTILQKHKEHNHRMHNFQQTMSHNCLSFAIVQRKKKLWGQLTGMESPLTGCAELLMEVMWCITHKNITLTCLIKN